MVGVKHAVRLRKSVNVYIQNSEGLFYDGVAWTIGRVCARAYPTTLDALHAVQEHHFQQMTLVLEMGKAEYDVRLPLADFSSRLRLQAAP